MEYVSINPKKLENIGLSFSGGGFRACAYSLGCLSYFETVEFDNKKLISLVRFISSASGGSITNLAFTVSQRKKIPFADFYNDLNKNILDGTELVNRVFEILKSKDHWKQRPSKSRNIINAFSIAYDELIFKGATFEIYLNEAPNVVDEVCINTTEFDNGMLFRFQNKGTPGNKFIRFKKDGDTYILKDIKLGDVLACSSCFPVGFEPFMFPEDFSYSSLSTEQLKNGVIQDNRFSPVVGNKNTLSKFGFMDGGIDDNQGIGSFILAEDRLQRENNFGYDLYISCDVSSNYTSGYDFPEENKKSLFQKLSILQYFLIVALGIVISTFGILSGTFYEASIFVAGIFFVLLFVMLIPVFYLQKTQRAARTDNNTFAIVILSHLPIFLRLRISTLFQMLASRATSAAYLAAVVFLKKIRRISYDRLFEKITERYINIAGNAIDTDKTSEFAKAELKHWKDFSIQNAIYLLTMKNNHQRIKNLKEEQFYKNDVILLVDNEKFNLIDFLNPTDAVQSVAELASEMDTTLWFDQNHEKEDLRKALIATGQFTSCFNLLRYSLRFDRSDLVWNGFQQTLAKDWLKFKQDPYWMYNKMAK